MHMPFTDTSASLGWRRKLNSNLGLSAFSAPIRHQCDATIRRANLWNECDSVTFQKTSEQFGTFTNWMNAGVDMRTENTVDHDKTLDSKVNRKMLRKNVLPAQKWHFQCVIDNFVDLYWSAMDSYLTRLGTINLRADAIGLASLPLCARTSCCCFGNGSIASFLSNCFKSVLTFVLFAILLNSRSMLLLLLLASMRFACVLMGCFRSVTPFSFEWPNLSRGCLATVSVRRSVGFRWLFVKSMSLENIYTELFCCDWVCSNN